MSEDVRADISVLSDLSAVVAASADAIEAISIDKHVRMPGSPIIAAWAANAIPGAYCDTGRRLRRLADICGGTVLAYAESDAALAVRLQYIGR